MQPTIEQWRQNKELVRIAGEVVNSASWARIREVILANRPTGVIPFNATGTDAGNALGQMRGYLQCLATIELLAEPETPPVALQATFKPENNEDEHSS